VVFHNGLTVFNIFSWSMELSTSSTSLRVEPNWRKRAICWRTGLRGRGTSTRWMDGPDKDLVKFNKDKCKVFPLLLSTARLEI